MMAMVYAIWRATEAPIKESGDSLSNGEMIAWAAVILGPLSGFAGYLLSSWRSKKDTEATREIARENATVAGRNAAAQEFSILTQAYQAEFARLNKRVSALEDDNNVLVSDVDSLVEHVEKLEDLIPNPPGAPERPKLHRHRPVNPI